MNPAIKGPFGNRQQRCTLHTFTLVLLTAVLTFTPQSSFSSPKLLWWASGFPKELPDYVPSRQYVKQVVCQAFHNNIINWNKNLPTFYNGAYTKRWFKLLRVEEKNCVIEKKPGRLYSIERIVLYYDRVFETNSGSEERVEGFYDTKLYMYQITRDEAPSLCQTSSNNPVNIVTGNKHFAETDYTGKGQFPIRFTRYFNSRSLMRYDSGYSRNHWESSSGHAHWSHSYQNSMIIKPSPNINDWEGRVYRPDGSTIYLFGGPNYVHVDAATGLTETNTTNGGIAVITPDNVVEHYNKRGVLQSLRHIPSGETQTLKYDPSAKTIAVHHSLGYAITIHFRTVEKFIYLKQLPHIIVNYRHPYKVDTPEGTYRYRLRTTADRAGEVIYGNAFTQVTFPDNTTKQYRYEDRHHPDKVTRIINALGHDEAVVTYDKTSGRVLSSALANGVEQLNFSYSPAEEGSTTVTNALGHSATYHYKNILDIPRFTSIEGQKVCSGCADASAYTYDHWADYIISKTDHKGNKTHYTWNRGRGLQTARTEAVGTPVERTIRTQWHPKFRLPIKITEPGKQTVMRYDSKGRLLSRTERALP